MSEQDKQETRKRQIKRALRSAAIGVVAALVCRALPLEYQGPCETVLKICTGSL